MTTNTSPPGAPRTIGQLALELHHTWSEKLTIDVSCSEAKNLIERKDLSGFSVSGEVLTFSALSDRNRFAAHELFDGGGVSDAISLFEAADDLLRYEMLHSEHAAARLLLLAAESRDVLLEAADALGAAPPRNPYGIGSLLGEVLPSLRSIQFASLRACCSALQSANNGSMVAAPFFVPLVDLLRDNQPLRVEALRDFEGVSLAVCTDLYRAALLALGIVDFDGAVRHAAEKVQGGDRLVREICIWVLARYCAKRQLSDEQVALVERMLRPHLIDQGSEVHRLACDVVVASMPVHQLCAEEWSTLLGTEDAAAMRALAAELPAILRAGSGDVDMLPLLNACIGFDSTSVAEIGHIDYVLFLLLGAGRSDSVIDWLTNWVRRHGSGSFNDHEVANLFDQTLYWLSKNPSTFEKVITRWLLEDGRPLPAAAGGLLSYASLHEVGALELEISVIDSLDAEGLVFLCRRLLGFVLNENQSLSLMLSLLKTQNASSRVHNLLREVVVNEIGYDYPTATVEQVKQARTQTSDAAEQTLLDEIVERVDASTSSIDELPVANELWPPVRLVRSFSRARQKDMAVRMREARDKSIFGKIAKAVPIKGGTGFFRYVDETFSDVAEMVPIRSSATLPRREIFDPVGQAYQRLHLQRSKRGDK